MKKYLKILLVLVMFTSMPVFAASNKLFRADNSVVLQEDLNGSGFVAGQSVDIDSKVDGILFAAGNTVDVDGESDYLFAAGNIVRIDGASFKDGFIAGSSVSLLSGNVTRDLYVAGSTIDLNISVGRNAHIAGNIVKFDGKVNGDLDISASNITIGRNAVITGKLSYPENATIEVNEAAKVGSIEKTVDYSKINSKTIIISRIYNGVISLLNIILVGILMLVFMPKIFDRIAKMSQDTILTNLGIGMLTFIFAPIAAFIIMFTLAGMSLGIIGLVLYTIALYLTSIFTGYYLSNMIFNKRIKNKYLVLVIGLVSIKILKFIPFIGIIVGIGSLCIGLGIIVSLIFKRK